MANHKSALKRQRQNIKRRNRNRYVRATIRTESKKLRQMTAPGADSSAEAIKEQLRKAEATIGSAAAKGVLHKRTASRRISRLAKLAAAK